MFFGNFTATVVKRWFGG